MNTLTSLPPSLQGSAAHLLNNFSLTLEPEQKARLQRGIFQAGCLWRDDDGSPAEFEAFVRENFIHSPALLDATFERLEQLLEQVHGHMHEISRALRWHTDLELGPMLPLDRLTAGYAPNAHLAEDLFRNRLAFMVLLNFPLTTLEQRVTEGRSWSRRQWAEARLALAFDHRVPATVVQELTRVLSEADTYIAEYNIWMHHLVDAQGQRFFPEGRCLISHWNLRDELKALYSEAAALHKQRLIAHVMEHIVLQTIPEQVINNPGVDWNPWENVLAASPVADGPARSLPEPIQATPEPDTRYHHLLATFQATRLEDPYYPSLPTLMERRFHADRELAEGRVRTMLENVLSSPLLKQVGNRIAMRLGRPLEPFDIWYSGFRPNARYVEADLDKLVQNRYPSIASFTEDMPGLLERMGFRADRAKMLASHIQVDPSRGAGHALGAARRGDKAHLRTRVGTHGMDYKGYNVAIHELGHNVEQTLSLYEIDHWLLNGVPNTAFTEAVAFFFQKRDLELLGLDRPDAHTHALGVLHEFWATAEIGGVALVDMQVWRWMYEHHDATPRQLKEAVLQLARDTWNRFYGPVMQVQDSVLLAIYSHMIDSRMYLPDYPIGHIISHQLEEHLERVADRGQELERILTLGTLAPDVWMEAATGQPVSEQPLLKATAYALEVLSARDAHA
ncbi:MAG: hypothetical protein ACKO6N_08970 [Myxococcota bacterium]